VSGLDLSTNDAVDVVSAEKLLASLNIMLESPTYRYTRLRPLTHGVGIVSVINPTEVCKILQCHLDSHPEDDQIMYSTFWFWVHTLPMHDKEDLSGYLNFFWKWIKGEDDSRDVVQTPC